MPAALMTVDSARMLMPALMPADNARMLMPADAEMTPTALMTVDDR